MHAPGRPDSGAGHYLRDAVYGAIDGVVTTLAVIAGVTGAALSPAVAIILGLANLVADGFSMGASNYLGLKSELEQKGLSVAAERPLRHGAATFAAFLIAGSIPLLAYAAPVGGRGTRFAVAGLAAGIVLFATGAARAPFTGKPAWRSGAEMFAVGALAGASAYVVGLVAEAILRA